MKIVFASEDERPKGSVLFADPSHAQFAGCIKTFNEPHSNSSHGTQRGIQSMTGHLVRYDDRTGYYAQESWSAMRRKRGFEENE